MLRDTGDCFETDKIDIDNIRVSKKYPCGNNGKYKNPVCYETEDNYVPLKIILRNIEGYYAEYKCINSMNFMLKNDAHVTIFDIFENIENKSNIEDIICLFETSNGNDYLKASVSRTTAFGVDGIENITPCKSDKYLCNVVIEIQLVQHETKDEDVKYYSQIRLTDCYCNIIKNDKKVNSILKSKKVNSILKSKNNKPKSDSKTKKPKSDSKNNNTESKDE